MAKASAQITISRIVDILSVTRYYLLQSSTSAAPSKPTANPPGGSWTTTEPAYTSGSTNTLYFVDLTVFTNSTFSYSAVSKSSSYEAAKAAYNKAVSAQSTANSAQSTANTALSQSIEYIVGTQTAATNAWKGVTTDAALSVGKTIAYKLPYAGNSSAATLNLTLSGGGTTGAISVKRLNSNVTNQYVAESVITMTYDGECWRTQDYYSDTYDRIRYYQAIKCGSTAIPSANVIVGVNGLYQPLNSGKAFDVSYPILYASGAINANGTSTGTYICNYITITSTQNISLTSYKPVYIKGTLDGTMFTPISTTPLTQTIPTTDDGYYYIHLGHAVNATRLYLLPEHPIYKYFNGKFMTVTQIAAEAAKTATNYMKFENNVGLIVGDMTANTLGKNVLIDADSVDIRDGSTVAASFSANSINLCGNAGYIYARGYDDTNVFDSLEIGSRNIDIVAPNTYMRTHSRVNSGGYANSVIQATTGNIVSGDSYVGDYSLASISSNSTLSNTSHASVSTTAFADHADASSVNINAVNGSVISNIEVTPTNIKLKTGAGEIIADSYMVFNQFAEFMGDVLFNDGFESDGGGNISGGHLYLTGSNASSSTGNTSQLVFGTSSSNHVVLSSNSHALVVNPTTSSTTNQIVLYLDKASVFPKGISANVTGNLTGTASKATADASGNTITSTYATKTELSQARAACSARGSATSLSLSAGAITALTLNTWVVRNDTAFTFSGGGIYCPRAGNIMVSGNVYFNSTAADNFKGVYITKNGSEVFSSYIKQNNGTFSMTSGMAIIPVAAGDIIRLCARCSAANKVNPSNAATLLSVAYV